jgi:large subunit ribosomal protein L5
MEQENKQIENKKELVSTNPMQKIEVEKIVINCGGTDEKLEKSIKLLKMITKDRKIYQISSTRRIPAFGISPGKKSGCKVTIRNKEEIMDLLKRFFAALDYEISDKKIVENHLSFGIPEYIEVPGLEYDRDIGILGFEVSVVFQRKGKRVKNKKIKQGKYPKKQNIAKEEILRFLTKHFEVEIV